MEIRETIDIEARPEHVFDVFSNLSTAAEIVSAITNIEVLEGPAQMQVGTRWRETRKLFGKEAEETMWITELVRPDFYTADAESHGARYRSTYRFAPTDRGTRVEFSFESTPMSLSSKVMGLFALLFMGATRKALRADLVELKAACESQSGNSAVAG